MKFALILLFAVIGLPTLAHGLDDAIFEFVSVEQDSPEGKRTILSQVQSGQDFASLTQEETQNKLKALAQFIELPASEGIYDLSRVWTQELSVCFYNGTSDEIELVKSVSAEIFSEIKLDVNFETEPCAVPRDSNIGVSFNNSDWNDGKIGTDSFHPSNRLKASINLDLEMADNEYNKKLKRFLILHEFMHGIGAKHEHQHPQINCLPELKPASELRTLKEFSRFSENEISSYFTALKAGKHEIAVASGVVRIEITLTKFDEKSIMAYKMDSRWFVNPSKSSCFKHLRELRTSLSPGDISGIQDIYGVRQ